MEQGDLICQYMWSIRMQDSNRTRRNWTFPCGLVNIKASKHTIPMDTKTLELLSNLKKTQALKCKTDFVLSFNGVTTCLNLVMQIIKWHAALAGVHRYPCSCFTALTYFAIDQSGGKNHWWLKNDTTTKIFRQRSELTGIYIPIWTLRPPNKKWLRLKTTGVTAEVAQKG